MSLIPKLACDFLFDKEQLSDYGMILCNFDGNGDGTFSFGNNITFNTVKPALSNVNFLSSVTYEDTITTTFQMCKNTCNNTELTLYPDEISAITRWLCRKECCKLKIYQDGYEDLYFNGSFNNPQEIKIGGKICGLEFTFVSNAPYAYLDSVILNFTTSSASSFCINNLSHEVGNLYPSKFTCKCLTNGDLIIKNSLDTKSVELKNCIKGEIITLDGIHKIIESNVVAHENIYNDFNYNFFRLVSTYYDFNNIITTSIPCEISLEYNPIRKVGI